MAMWIKLLQLQVKLLVKGFVDYDFSVCLHSIVVHSADFCFFIAMGTAPGVDEEGPLHSGSSQERGTVKGEHGSRGYGVETLPRNA